MKDLHKSVSEKKDIVVSSLLFSHIFVDVVHIVCYVASVDSLNSCHPFFWMKCSLSYSLGLLFGVFILKSAISQHCWSFFSLLRDQEVQILVTCTAMWNVQVVGRDLLPACRVQFVKSCTCLMYTSSGFTSCQKFIYSK